MLDLIKKAVGEIYTLVAKTLSIGNTYTTELIANGALTWEPMICEPSSSSSCSTWCWVDEVPWNAMFRAARYVQRYTSSKFLEGKIPYCREGPTKQFV